MTPILFENQNGCHALLISKVFALTCLERCYVYEGQLSSSRISTLLTCYTDLNVFAYCKNTHPCITQILLIMYLPSSKLSNYTEPKTQTHNLMLHVAQYSKSKCITPLNWLGMSQPHPWAICKLSTRDATIRAKAILHIAL